MTRTVGVREAKAHFSELIAAARDGHDVVVTDRGRPVARLVPMRDAGVDVSGSERELFEMLAAAGLVEPAARRARPRQKSRLVRLRRALDLTKLVRDLRR